MKSASRPFLTLTAASGVLAISGVMAMAAQQTSQAPPPPERGMTFSLALGQDGRGIKGSPYSAEEIRETTQALADGNRITQRTTGKVFRDSQGRFRREVAPLWAISPGTPNDSASIVTIDDAASRVTYILNTRTHTARKREHPAITARKPVDESRTPPQSVIMPIVPGTEAGPFKRETKTESLGEQLIEGFLAKGTRFTITFPAGTVGNEQPIETVRENWYSPELRAVLLRRNNDPRFGETVVRLVNIEIGEPSPELFEVPADYTIEEMSSGSTFFGKKPADKNGG